MTNINGWFPGNKLRGIGYQLMVLSNGFMFIDMMRWLVDVDVISNGSMFVAMIRGR
jgi:hypothetical protein